MMSRPRAMTDHIPETTHNVRPEDLREREEESR